MGIGDIMDVENSFTVTADKMAMDVSTRVVDFALARMADNLDQTLLSEDIQISIDSRHRNLRMGQLDFLIYFPGAQMTAIPDRVKYPLTLIGLSSFDHKKILFFWSIICQSQELRCIRRLAVTYTS